MTKLLVFYLTNSCRHFTFQPYINLLNESKDKSLWKLIVLSHSNDLEFYEGILNKTDIIHSEFNFEDHNNYLNKVNFAIK